MLNHDQKVRDQQIVEAYNQGHDACLANQSFNDNPHKDTYLSRYWESGFKDAWIVRTLTSE